MTNMKLIRLLLLYHVAFEVPGVFAHTIPQDECQWSQADTNSRICLTTHQSESATLHL